MSGGWDCRTCGVDIIDSWVKQYLPRECDLGCVVCSVGNVVCDVGNVVCDVGNVVCDGGGVFVGEVYRGYSSDRENLFWKDFISKNLFRKDFLENCGGFFNGFLLFLVLTFYVITNFMYGFFLFSFSRNILCKMYKCNKRTSF